MATYALEWDKTGDRYWEMGISQVALFPMTSGTYGDGVAWNGVTGIDESPEGADASDIYADDVKYATMRSAETFKFTVKAYTYPDEWVKCDGSAQVVDGLFLGQQDRQSFGLAYITKKGNDTSATYQFRKLHLVYNSSASPSDKSYETINDNPDAIEFSWECTSTAVNVGTGNYKPVSTIVIDEEKITTTKFETIMKKVYGDGSQTSSKASFPSPAEVISTLSA